MTRIEIILDVKGTERPVLVRAREIAGTRGVLAVHATSVADVEEGRGPWTVTHVPTGRAVATAGTCARAVELGEAIWKRLPAKVRRVWRGHDPVRILASTPVGVVGWE